MNRKAEQTDLLSREQMDDYREQGYILLPSFFSPESVAALQSTLPQVMFEKTERTIYEADKTTIRSVYAIHKNNEVFSKLGRHPVLVSMARQILGGPVYIYQSKINWKPPFAGTKWDWHQDFTFWHHEDAMPMPRAINISLFLDEVNEFNGPLYMIPGSHRSGIQDYESLKEKPVGYELAPSWISNLTATINYSVDRECLVNLIRKRSIASPKGPSGSVLIFDSNIVHASPPNITPFDRTVVMYTYNHVDNAPPESKRRRPEFLSSSDSRPIEIDDAG